MADVECTSTSPGQYSDVVVELLMQEMKTLKERFSVLSNDMGELKKQVSDLKKTHAVCSEDLAKLKRQRKYLHTRIFYLEKGFNVLDQGVDSIDSFVRQHSVELKVLTEKQNNILRKQSKLAENKVSKEQFKQVYALEERVDRLNEVTNVLQINVTQVQNYIRQSNRTEKLLQQSFQYMTDKVDLSIEETKTKMSNEIGMVRSDMDKLRASQAYLWSYAEFNTVFNGFFSAIGFVAVVIGSCYCAAAYHQRRQDNNFIEQRRTVFYQRM